MESSWHSYPSIFALGHRAVKDLLSSSVLVEEKIDGSQFSFGVSEDGTYVRARSKGAALNMLAPEKMFSRAAAIVEEKAQFLHPGWTYRGEYLTKPKHNVLCYDRVPKDHIILFDINDGYESYLSYEAKKAEAERLGFEVVPRIFEGMIDSVEVFRQFLDKDSVLGGQKVEGVVVKNYALFGPDKKVLMGKFVSEAFKEIQGGEWRKENPPPKDILTKLIERYKTDARWQKAVLHLTEAGKIEGAPQDIPKLLVEVPEDVLKECEGEIRDALFKWGWDRIRRGITAGLPQWYKEQLLKKQFADE